ncbi:hypothetical protein ACYCSE_11690 [Paenibacillus sp. SEL1]|uniref:hypothetical protein n=1 Tax=Paenibacillus TaxID=44249 RepID=UPI00077C12F3|nr:hypothetical protein [Paenibacillus polymyxa]MCF2717092.1 hypothetical protein [Paenibacillus sp. UKAQ_18]AOK91044.1 hypothetical protein AOU00_15195 [Paenibacillus polymyxa]KYG94852.1 hypothetical protein AZE31_13645 [Paenibacillus polymyxa]MDY7991454.1 hypothetical protein [Paenibacillus polymyxa]MDY8117895.1 hypothetical protein [Paenibacillus polymyxa]
METKSTILEWAAMVYGPFDHLYMYEIYEGVLYGGRYFFHIEDGRLWMRHVRRIEHPEHTRLFVDGDSGGLQLAEGIQRDLMEVVSETIDQLRSMDGMTFLLNELLWLEGEDRYDIQLNLVKNKG